MRGIEREEGKEIEKKFESRESRVQIRARRGGGGRDKLNNDTLVPTKLLRRTGVARFNANKTTSTNASPVKSLLFALPTPFSIRLRRRGRARKREEFRVIHLPGRGGTRLGRGITRFLRPSMTAPSVLIPEAGKALKSEQTKSYGESLVLDPVDPV